MRTGFFLYLFFLISCAKDWEALEKQKFIDDCLSHESTEKICECEYGIAIQNFTFEEYKAISNQIADKKTRDRVNSIRADIEKCKN